MKITKEEALSVLTKISQGLPPEGYLHLVRAARTDETHAIMDSIAMAMRGIPSVRFIVGDNGSGKSYLMDLTRELALKKGLAVATASLGCTARLHDTEERVDRNLAVATYRRLVRTLSTADAPEAALEGILQRIVMQSAARLGIRADSPDGLRAGLIPIQQDMAKHLVGSAPDRTFFGGVSHLLCKYAEGFILEDESLKEKVLRWFSADYGNKTDVYRDLGIKEKVSGSNWLDMLQRIARLVTLARYNGLVILIDESGALCDIVNPDARKNNYAVIHSIYDRQDWGSMFFLFAGTSQLLRSESRGLYSDPHLKSRLTEVRSGSGAKNYDSPLFSLTGITDPAVLLTYVDKIRKVAETAFGWETAPEDQARVESRWAEDEEAFLLGINERESRRLSPRMRKEGTWDPDGINVPIRTVGMQFAADLRSMKRAMDKAAEDGGDPSSVRFADFIGATTPAEQKAAQAIDNNIKVEMI